MFSEQEIVLEIVKICIKTRLQPTYNLKCDSKKSGASYSHRTAQLLTFAAFLPWRS